jgi:hypothetical protein
MNAAKQFFALFKFQAAIKPFIWMIPFIVSTPFFIRTDNLFSDIEHADSNIYFIVFFVIVMVAPEYFQFGASAVQYISGTEFLLTRAVDRHLLHRTRSVFAYGIVLLLPTLFFLAALFHPSADLSDYSTEQKQAIVQNIPGSLLHQVPDKDGMQERILVPRGNILLAAWHLWQFLLAAILGQFFVWLIAPLPYRQFLFGAIFLCIIFIPFVSLFALSSSIVDIHSISWNEKLFFIFAAHPLLFLVLSLAVAVLVQLWCERRFVQLEH